MGRSIVDNAPVEAATSDDIIWAAALFESRGRYALNGTDISLLINGRLEDSFQQELQRKFGGSVYGLGANTARWQMTGQRLRRFLQSIEPYLTVIGRNKAAGYIRVCEGIDMLRSDARVRPDRPSSPNAEPVPRVDAFPLMDGVDEDQLELVLKGNAENDAGETLLRAKTAAHASEWVKALVGIVDVHVEHGVLLRVERRAS